jgi:nitrite reductase/ring-hydroxylating ferredoxin subunit
MNTQVQAVADVFSGPGDQSEVSDLADDQVSRRTFCNRLIMTSSGLLVGACALPSASAQRLSQVAYPPTRIEGAEGLMPGSALYFNYPTRKDAAILVRSQTGQYYAFGQKCSHRGCSVYFDRTRSCLACPCHLGAYDAQSGLVLNGPPTQPLDQIVLQMRAGGGVWAVGRSIGGGEKYA